MLVGVASLPPTFPPSGTWAFYIINRPNCVNICNTVYMKIFYKADIQKVILRRLVCLNPNWMKSNDIVSVMILFFFMPENASFQG